MAISTTERFYDDCSTFNNNLSTAGFLSKLYGATTGLGGITTSSTAARTGTARLYSSSTQATLSYYTNAAPTTLVMGFAVSSAGSTLPAQIIRELLGVRYGGSDIFFLRANVNKKIELVSGSTVLGTTTTSAIALNAGSYVYIEVGLYLNGASSEVYVRINNTTEILYVGSFAQTSFDEIQFRTTGSGTTTYHDDIYIHYGSGSIAASDFLGDIAVYALVPDADSTPFEWLPIPVTTNEYQHIDDIPSADPPTTYLYEDTNNQQYYVSLGALDAAATSIVGVCLVGFMGKGGFGGSAVNARMRYKTGGNEYQSSTYTLSSTFAYYKHYWVNDPHTGTAWTKAVIDAAFWGAQKVV